MEIISNNFQYVELIFNQSMELKWFFEASQIFKEINTPSSPDSPALGHLPKLSQRPPSSQSVPSWPDPAGGHGWLDSYCRP